MRRRWLFAPAARPTRHFLCENQGLHTQSNFRLLVVRLGAMGDILHALPAVTALRRAHPAWHIGWIVEPRWMPLLYAGNQGTSRLCEQRSLAGEHGGEQGNENVAAISFSEPSVRGPGMPIVDQLHFAPTREWKRRPLRGKTASGIRALAGELRAANYDAVLDLQGAIRSAAIGRLSGCSRRIGDSRPREWPAHWLFSERVVTRCAHGVERAVELVSAVAGDTLCATEPLLPLDPEAETWCESFLAEAAPPASARPIALLTPGAGWGAKRWPPERYRAVAQGLKQRGFSVLVNAGPGEEPLAAAITDGDAAIALSATLRQLIALTRRIALCIGGDTGPLHLACALGRPVVGIYGPTDPSRNGPYGTHARVLRCPASRTDHSRRAAPDPGLLTIAPEDVLRAADELLAEVRA